MKKMMGLLKVPCCQAGFILLLGIHIAFADFKAVEPILNQSGCMVCHSKTQKIVGPAFQDVAQKYQSEKDAVQTLTQSVQKGSQGKWGEVPMPPQTTVSTAQLQEILKGILSLAQEDSRIIPSGLRGNNIKKEIPTEMTEPSVSSSEDDILYGQNLFQGKIRLTHGGPTCISCHHVKNDAVIGGGVLAKDLTSVFSRLGGAGVQAILGQPPFPVMEQAYLNHPLTKKEVDGLMAFLKYADENRFYQTPRDYGMGLFLSGVFGSLFFLLFFLLLGTRRKRFSVNHEMFLRQIKSKP